MNNYIPLNIKSHFSILSSSARPKQISKRLEELDIGCAGLTDLNNISGSIQYIKEMQKANMKPILGLTLGICEEHSTIKTKENDSRIYISMLAKNNEAWQSLIKITSLAHHPDSFYRKPRLSFDELSPNLKGNFIGFSGRENSHIGARILDREGNILPNWKVDARNMAFFLRDLFGKDNFYLEVNVIDNSFNSKILGECIRELSKDTGIPCVAMPNPHYCRQQDSEDHKILICRNYKQSLFQFNKAKQSPFAKSNNFHIPSFEEMEALHEGVELDNTHKIASEIGDYDVLRNPQLPAFSCPNNMSEQEYLRHLCVKGWEDKLLHKVGNRKQEYGDRIKYELGVLEKNNLSGYFLILADIMKFCRDNDWIVGAARGSSGGCIVSYLAGITEVDPIPYGLIFERFYNDARSGSLPDIDVDVPVLKRAEIIEYIKNKYGKENVAQICAFQKMKGRGAIKDVARAHNKVSAEEVNRITSNIPDEAKIADELQEMQENGLEPSIIMWALEHRKSKFEEWCVLKDDGTLDGPLAYEFSQAIRLEGTNTAYSKHAAGVCISVKPVGEIAPIMYDDKTKNPIVMYEKDDTEAAGLVKLDLLGLALCDKLQTIRNIAQNGYDTEEEYDEHYNYLEEMDD